MSGEGRHHGGQQGRVTGLTKEEYRVQRTLEEAQKRGMITLGTGASGFKVNTPWMQNTTRAKAQALPAVVAGSQKASMEQWFPRGAPEQQVYKYRDGACENCGAMTHKRKDCVERPRKVGAKFTGQNFQGDERMMDLDFSYEARHDRWNGFNPDSYMEKVKEYNLTTQKAEEENMEKGEDINEGFKRKMMNRMYLDPTSDPKTKTPMGLRQDGDIPKYLLNLEDDSAVYDAKSRAMNANPKPSDQPGPDDFIGDLQQRHTGGALELMAQDRFAHMMARQDPAAELNSYALPTLTEMKYKLTREQKSIKKGERYNQIAKQYGGESNFINNVEDLLISKDQYVEYDERGALIDLSKSQTQGKSRYPEDKHPQDHTSVWGSWWNKELGWGFACCHGTDRNGNCYGDKGKKMAIIKEYKVVLKREAELKYRPQTESNCPQLTEASRRVSEMSKLIDEQKIHVNLEGHKAFEKNLQEVSQKRIEVEKNNKFTSGGSHQGQTTALGKRAASPLQDPHHHDGEAPS